MKKTPTRAAYDETLAKLLAVARTYVHVPEQNVDLERTATMALQEAAVDFYWAEKDAWEAGDLATKKGPTF
ncbi:MAG: hypothetical protein KJN79_00170 [Gammaproteobacteria bacterium]|nr:hypothetical protein [Gammaproteobacteria bacterium]